MPKLIAKTRIRVLPRTTPQKCQGDYVGRQCWDRSGTTAGVVTGTSLCRLEGCRGLRLHVQWPDGHRTYPCTKGCRVRDDGELQII